MRNNTETHRKGLILLLKNQLIQYIMGMFICCFLLKTAGYLPNVYTETIFKSLGFGIFFYFTTPFTIYWLAYVSVINLTKISLAITITILSIYSYALWDSYFFYRKTLAWLLSLTQV